jgi:hypothetical protein
MGYVHDVHMAQYIPPNAFHYVTGTWTQTAGVIADTIALHRAQANETTVITIPIMIPCNSVAEKGTKLTSIELDYELLGAANTSVTPVLNKVTRAADGTVAGVAAVTQTMNLAAATTAATQDQHRMIVTVTTPTWTDNDEYYLLQVSIVAGAGATTTNILAAVANYTLRM